MCSSSMFARLRGYVVETPRADFLAILNALSAHDVDFIVVGGISAVLQGASISTFDLNVVHSLEPENVTRLLAALEGLDAFYRSQASLSLRPDRTSLESTGHQLLMTRGGPLDILGRIGNDRRYEDLLANCVEMSVGEGHPVHVLDLATLIELKQQLGSDKDKAVLPVLLRTLKESLEEKNRH